MDGRTGANDLRSAQTFGEGRYRVVRVLGEGGQKVVYLVHDAIRDRECALSVLKASDGGTLAAQRFEGEARAITSLRNHPHVVDVYDFGYEDGVPYLVSEYLTGGDLRTEIRNSDGALDIDRVLTVTRNIADALSAAHARGIVHRDVTPANVWFESDGRLKLGDFGVSAEDVTAGSAPSVAGVVASTGGIVGTAAYMAPEQALALRCDAASDLYSLGVIMYEMATGRQPFAGDDPLGVLSQQISDAPVAPSWHNASIPKALEELILSLLAKVPEDRPGSAEIVLRALHEIAEHPDAGEDAEVPSRAANSLDRLATGVFVGRSAELERLRSAIDAAFDETTRGQTLVLISGEPGIGKTRLVEQLATYARLRQAEVCWGRCFEGEGAPAFWPWIQILRALAESIDDDRLRDEINDGSGLIAQILPGIETRLGLPAPSPASEQHARSELFAAISSWLVQRSRAAPLVLILDDVHQADEGSLLFVQHLVESVPDIRIAIVFTYREGEVGDNRPLREFLSHAAEKSDALEVRLQGLSEADVAAYIESATGHAARAGLTGIVHTRTDGNALFVSETVRMLTQSGEIDREATSWTGTVPPEVREVIERRLERLSPACRSVLTTASVIGREFEAQVVECASGMSRTAVQDAVTEAEAAQLVSAAPGTTPTASLLTFTHALVRDTLYDGISIDARQATHARIAAVLEEMFGTDLGERINSLAHHFREGRAAGDAAKAAQYSIDAGNAARRVFAYEEVVRQWAAAAELLGALGRLEEQARLLQKASDVLYALGSFEESVRYVLQAADVWERAGNRQQLAGAQLRLGRTFTTDQTVGDLERAMKHLNAAIELYAGQDQGPALGYAYAALASAHDRALTTQAGLEAARRVRAMADHTANDNILALGLQLEGMFLQKLGRLDEGSTLENQAWDLAEKIGDGMVAYFCAWNRGYREREYLGDPRSSIKTHLRALEAEGSAQLGGGRADLRMGLAEGYASSGDLTSARAIDLPYRGRRFNDVKWGGSWDTFATECDIEVQRHSQLGNRLLVAIYRERVAIGLYYLGRFDEASDALSKSVAAFHDEDVGAEMRSRILLCLVSAARGRTDIAREQLSRCDEIVAQGQEWRGQVGLIEVARGATMAQCAGISEASGAFTRAIDILRRYGLVWDEAEALRLWGRALASVGDHDSAMDKYRRAIDIYRRIGAGAPWIARIVKEYAGADQGDPSRTLGV